MEVHHHPHVASHVHGKKKFKEYFLEFLMIFLAVTLGFFAENIRENFVEHKMQKEYILSFYEDIKTDTAKISGVIAFDQNKIDIFSTIAACYDSFSKNITTAPCMLNLIKNTTTNRPFQMTDRTLKQLDNTGGYRLLLKEDADSIIKYQSAFNLLQDLQATIFQEAQDNVRNTYNIVINFKANLQMKQSKPGTGLDFPDRDITAPLLSSNDKALFNKYFNELLLYNRIIISQQRLLNVLKHQQIALIEYFKSKYHFE
jgi:hypothetical protein